MTFLIQQTLLYAVPLMIVALAGVFAERSGCGAVLITDKVQRDGGAVDRILTRLVDGRAGEGELVSAVERKHNLAAGDAIVVDAGFFAFGDDDGAVILGREIGGRFVCVHGNHDDSDDRYDECERRTEKRAQPLVLGHA